MVEVFITDIQNNIQEDIILNNIQKDYTDLKINFDLNETDLSFPCGHTILRIEGNKINSDKIMETVRNQGFNCEILEDKICK
ncbi:MAG: hypothetical protein M0D53_00455 [Flavobacterium sp. JAD_PAG50586_2]|nr:MAG: hypothetical protein M0D53_00455 [Flavobacterium sp. JAD_PAG50586_2]